MRGVPYDCSKDDSPEISPAMADDRKLLASGLICQGAREYGDARQNAPKLQMKQDRI
jgi:hypothetical protein